MAKLDLHPEPLPPNEATRPPNEALQPPNEASEPASSSEEPEPASPNEAPRPSERIEILEAGTGMGCLTLYLARALHAGNPFASDTVRHAAQEQFTSQLSAADKAALTDYKARRQCVVHSVEMNTKYAAHASQIIASFHNGLYAPTIDQYVGDVSAWIETEFRRRCTTKPTNPLAPFLDHIILDLPEAEKHLGMAELALRPDGLLVLFVPSISQVQEAVLHVRAARLALILDDVLEIGTNVSGGRQWAVELARIRNRSNVANAHRGVGSVGNVRSDVESGEERDPSNSPSPSLSNSLASSIDRSSPSSTSSSTSCSTSSSTSSSTSATTSSTSSSISYSSTTPSTTPSIEQQLATAFSTARATPPPQRSAAFGLVARPRAVSLAGGSFLAIFRKVHRGWQDGGVGGGGEGGNGGGGDKTARGDSTARKSGGSEGGEVTKGWRRGDWMRGPGRKARRSRTEGGGAEIGKSG